MSPFLTDSKNLGQMCKMTLNQKHNKAKVTNSYKLLMSTFTFGDLLPAFIWAAVQLEWPGPQAVRTAGKLFLGLTICAELQQSQNMIDTWEIALQHSRLEPRIFRTDLITYVFTDSLVMRLLFTLQAHFLMRWKKKYHCCWSFQTSELEMGTSAITLLLLESLIHWAKAVPFSR